MSHIAFLGTGLLGAAFVEAALGRGESVTVWNRSAAKAEALRPFGARVAATPDAAVANADRVHLVLQDDASVEAVIAALRPGLKPAAIIVDHTTTQPQKTAERLARLNAEGLHYLHCPVFIGPVAARKSEGIILASGPQRHFAAVQPALARMATRVEYFGERGDLAAAYKLIGNCMLLSITGVVADAFAIGAGVGITPSDTMKLLDFFNPAGVIGGRGKKMAAGDYSATFELSMARKDVRLMLETAGDQPLATLPGLAARMDAMIAAGRGHEDIGVIAAR